MTDDPRPLGEILESIGAKCVRPSQEALDAVRAGLGLPVGPFAPLAPAVFVDVTDTPGHETVTVEAAPLAEVATFSPADDEIHGKVIERLVNALASARENRATACLVFLSLPGGRFHHFEASSCRTETIGQMEILKHALLCDVAEREE